MPTTLPTSIATAEKDQLLTFLSTAIVTSHGPSPIISFAHGIAGMQCADNAVQKRKDDMKGMPTNGSFGETGACTCLVRAHKALVEMGEEANASELLKITKQKFPSDVVERERAKVEAGW